MDKHDATVRFKDLFHFPFIIFFRLQDQCEPTPYEAVDAMFQLDMGKSLECVVFDPFHSPVAEQCGSSDLFEDFDPEPVGVASLAQVHVARLRETGEYVAVKACLFFLLPEVITSHVPSATTSTLGYVPGISIHYIQLMYFQLSSRPLTWKWWTFPLVRTI